MSRQCIQNHVDFLNNVGINDRDDFFTDLAARLDAIRPTLADREAWALLLMSLVATWAEKVAVELLPKIHTLTHDVHKSACQEAARLLAAAPSDAGAERLVEDVYGLLQLFEMASLRVGLARREAMPINISPVLTKVLGKAFSGIEAAEVEEKPASNVVRLADERSLPK